MSKRDRPSASDAGHGRGTSRPAGMYLALLLIQTIAASAIIAAIQSAFRIVADEVGVLHRIPGAALTALIAAMAVSQAAYWYRFSRIELPDWKHVVLGHCLGFASRLSFIFGGAMFSLFFLRHAPELISFQTGVPLLTRTAIMLAALFCLYCYALELDRLGARLQSSAGDG